MPVSAIGRIIFGAGVSADGMGERYFDMVRILEVANMSAGIRLRIPMDAN